LIGKKLRIGWLGDLDGHLPFEAGILDTCSQALGLAPERVWNAWLVWHRVLVASRIAPFFAQAGQPRTQFMNTCWRCWSASACWRWRCRRLRFPPEPCTPLPQPPSRHGQTRHPLA